jgi:hypothetical protein
MTKKAGSGSISQWHGSADPDPPQNVMDPEHCYKPNRKLRRKAPVCSVLGPTHGGVVPAAAPRLSSPMQHRRLLAATPIHLIPAHQLFHRAVHPEAVIVLLQLLGRQLGVPEVGQHVLLLLGIVHGAAGGRPQLAQVGRIHF